MLIGNANFNASFVRVCASASEFALLPMRSEANSQMLKKCELVLSLNKDDSILKYNSDNPLEIDFKIKYDIPIITKYLGMKNSIEYDFSDVTIRFVVHVSLCNCLFFCKILLTVLFWIFWTCWAGVFVVSCLFFVFVFLFCSLHDAL